MFLIVLCYVVPVHINFPSECLKLFLDDDKDKDSGESSSSPVEVEKKDEESKEKNESGCGTEEEEGEEELSEDLISMGKRVQEIKGESVKGEWPIRS